MKFLPRVVHSLCDYLKNVVEFKRYPSIVKLLEAIPYGTVQRGKRLAFCVLPGRVLLYQYPENLVFNYEIVIAQHYDALYPIHGNDVVLDVGAHVGVFTVYAARKARKGIVLAVEPHPINFKLLNLNVQINEFKNVLTFNIALTNHTGKVKLYIHTRPGGHSIVIRRTDKFVVVGAETIDNLFKKINLRNIESLFIKINAEGAEIEVLEGGKDTLKRVNDCRIVASCSHFRGEAALLVQLLKKLGFKHIVYDRTRGLVYASKEHT